MKKSDLFWGIALVAVGAGILLGRLIGFSIWQFIGPALLIGVGAWFIWGSAHDPQEIPVQETVIPWTGEHRRVLLKVKHGMGKLAISGGAEDDELLRGTFVGGVEYDERTQGDNVTVSLAVPRRNFWPPRLPPWNQDKRGFGWDVSLNERAPLAIEIEGGMSEQTLDLTELNCKSLRYAGGMATSQVMLPRYARHTRIRIDSGMATIGLSVPEGVAARITSESGLATLNVDETRFQKHGDIYVSPDYDQAENTVEIDIHQGLGTVSVA